MATLYLVRHGQASFGAKNYDQLSPLGEDQSRRLGQYWAARGRRFDAVFTGSLQRHHQTLAGIAEGLGMRLDGELTPCVRPGLNEYDGDAILQALPPIDLPDPRTPEGYRQHFRRLREGLAQWMQARITPAGAPTYADWRAGIAQVLDEVLNRATSLPSASGTPPKESANVQVLLVSSGGPISTAVGLVLGMPPEATIELNLRLRNSSVTEFSFTPKRHQLLTFNTLPHLDAPQLQQHITYA